MKAADVGRLYRQINTLSLHSFQMEPGDDYSTIFMRCRKAKQNKAKAVQKTGVPNESN